MTCRVTPCHRIKFPMAWNPKIHTRYLLVENSNFIGDKSGRTPGSSRAEDVCWDKQGHQGLSVLIHNTMPLCIDNNTMHSMHTMQIIYNIVHLFIIFCSYWQHYSSLCNKVCSALTHNTMHFCIILCTHWQQYASVHYSQYVLIHKITHTIHECSGIHKIVYTLQKQN